jgi:hypothetical protein
MAKSPADCGSCSWRYRNDDGAGVNCVVPIRIRLVGRPTDQDLVRLEDTVARLVARQLLAAQRALHEGGHAGAGAQEQVQDRDDPAQRTPEVAEGGSGTVTLSDIQAKVAPPPPPEPLPTRQQLNAEVDRMFREFFPDAPKQLDPNDPKQADLVETWLGVRDAILDQWTDRVFFSFFPNAPKKLDPNRPEDAQLIDFWTDIRQQIRDGMPGRYHWGPQAPAPTPRRPRTPRITTAPPAPAPPLRIRDIHHFGRGRFALDFDTDPGVAAAAAFVFPRGIPHGVTVSVYGPRQILFEHITLDSLTSMPDWLSTAFSQAGQGYEDDPKQRPAARPPVRGKPHPEIDIDTPEELHTWVEEVLHGVHVVGAVAELIEYLTLIGENIAYTRAVATVGAAVVEATEWGGAGALKVTKLHHAGRIAGVIVKGAIAAGHIALIFWVGYKLIGAFESEKEGPRRLGYLYGVMWQALDEPDHIPVFDTPGMTYSAEELREAFVEGVAEGRKKGQETKIREGIKLWVASLAVESGLGEWAAAHIVITELSSKSQKRKPRYQLQWPTPFPYIGIVGLFLD